MDLIIILKKKELGRGGVITGLSEVTVQEGCLMEGYASIEPLGFAMYVPLDLTIGPTTINKTAMIVLQRILTSLFIPVYMFAIVTSYFSV